MSLLLAFALQAAVAVPVSATEQKILVIAQKLKNWRGEWKQKKGVNVCKTRKSTGDKQIDLVGCEALLACASKFGPDLQRIAESTKNKKEFSERSKPIYDEMGKCVFSEREKGIAALADKRAGVGE